MGDTELIKIIAPYLGGGTGITAVMIYLYNKISTLTTAITNQNNILAQQNIYAKSTLEQYAKDIISIKEELNKKVNLDYCVIKEEKTELISDRIEKSLEQIYKKLDKIDDKINETKHQ